MLRPSCVCVAAKQVEVESIDRGEDGEEVSQPSQWDNRKKGFDR